MLTTNLPNQLHVLVPFWGLAGGVIKVLDYAAHGVDLGIDVTLWAPPIPDESAAIHQLPVARRLIDDTAVELRALVDLSLPEGQGRSAVLFTEPTHHRLIEEATETPLGASLIHLVQGTRHANPEWQNGMNYRLLHRPMTRIAVTPQVFDAIAPLVNRRFPLHTILEGHATDYFGGRPQPHQAADSARSPTPLRVLYTTWKSDLGDRVAAHLSTDRRFAFTALRTETTWPALRNRYHAADVLLCTPGPEEGFYLPGIEAMAAGVVVVSAEVGGNASYLVSETNAVVVEYDDTVAHADALIGLAQDSHLRATLRDAGRQTVGQHTLNRERGQFKAVLESLGPN